MGGLFYWGNEMRFKSHVGKQVMCGQKIIAFVVDHYETDDEAEIKALSGAIDVQKVDAKREAAKNDTAQKNV